ncbi:MAG TPA: enoyl-CoA hydratase/isomerase family protein [Acidimicrobiia bacterium]|jgi:enoyl-CoA hydratase/carnithine racemase
MAKRTRFEDYRDKYPSYRLEKSEDKILLFQLHTAGKDFVWDWEAHDSFGDVCADIAGDRDVNVVIFTGTGDTFMDSYGPADPDRPLPASQDQGAERLDLRGWCGRQRHLNMLDIQVPVIAAINGACSIHSELPVMCDIVLAAEHSSLQDSAHFPRGVVPGDGVHTVWPMVIGRNRARYFLLTGQKLTAQQLLEYGAVNEVLPREHLMDRAWELAHILAMRPPLTLRLTRSVLVQEFKRAAVNDLAAAQYQELYAMRNFFSYRGGKDPLDRAWNDDPWADWQPT